MNSRNAKSIIAILAASLSVNAQYTATYDPNNLPVTSEQDQIGTNSCGTENNQTSLCQNVYVNSVNDFCVWGPIDPNTMIGNVEQTVIAYCGVPGRGGRLFPEGTLKSAHFVETPDYIQVTGEGDFTKINIAAGDGGGELDPHGADGMGNPHGGLVFSNVWSGKTGLGQQVHEWTNFQSATGFCIRVCKEGPNARTFCATEYDLLGCNFNIPGNYGEGFSNCKADSVIPMGRYPQPDGTTSTFHQGQGPTPEAQPPAASSECTTYASSTLFAVVTPTATGTATATESSSSDDRTGAATRSSGISSFSFLAAIIGAVSLHSLF